MSGLDGAKQFAEMQNAERREDKVKVDYTKVRRNPDGSMSYPEIPPEYPRDYEDREFSCGIAMEYETGEKVKGLTLQGKDIIYVTVKQGQNPYTKDKFNHVCHLRDGRIYYISSKAFIEIQGAEIHSF